jgi:maltooligosyltrehalose trehalohydrolase
MRLAGAVKKANETTFTVWAPLKNKMVLHLVNSGDRLLEMQKDDEGNFTLTVPDLPVGSRYFFRPEEEKDLPDPASQFQPEGVHGPSEVMDHDSYQWQDGNWKNIPLQDMIIYELHVGTFTKEGTFYAAIARLDDLRDLGINCIELMPVAQFPGERNWGYDAVFPYAVQNSYGGPSGLKKLVGACHEKGIAVFLDVVYNHLGPEGNYLGEFAPYFTDKYKTPWGDAVNFDGEYSDGVRNYFCENIIYWFRQFHVDGLRLDAIHMIYDSGAVHFWEYCHQKVEALEEEASRRFLLIAESDLNSPKVIQKPSKGGYGFNAQWLDDFHHALYVLLDEKGKILYEDFGTIEQLAKAYKEGFVHTGQYVSFRKRKHGRSAAGVPGDKFVVFNQNHDQVGNRVKGERLSTLVDIEKLKMAAAAILLAPYIPMLFMGEEYADHSPFYYFVSHSDPQLIKAVQEGRAKEFENYKWDTEPPNPQDIKTFEDSKLKWNKRNQGEHARMLSWIRELIQLRNCNAVFKNYNKEDCNPLLFGSCGLVLERRSGNGSETLLCVFNFSGECSKYELPGSAKKWRKVLSSSDSSSNSLEQENNRNTIQLFESGNYVDIHQWSISVFSNSL